MYQSTLWLCLFLMLVTFPGAVFPEIRTSLSINGEGVAGDTENLRIGRGRVNDLAISLDGTRLAVATHMGLWLYTYPQMQDIATVDDQREPFVNVRYSPDGATLATTTERGPVVIRDAETGVAQHILSDTEGWIGGIAYTPDGRRLVTLLSDSAVVWDVATGQRQHRFEGDACCGFSMAISSDGTLLATYRRHQMGIAIWNIETGDLLHRLTGHEQSVRAMAFSPDGNTLAIGAMDSNIILWEVATGDAIARLEDHESVSILNIG